MTCLSISEEPNVRIMETKALVCESSPGGVPTDRRSTGKSGDRTCGAPA